MDLQRIVHAERERRRVHHLKTLLDRLLVRDLLDEAGIRLLAWVGALLLRFFGVADPGSTSILAVGVLSVLVMLFHKFIQPITILAALPPSAAGAIVALLAFDYSLAINSLIGLLMLMGIVSKNSILIVEYAIMAQRDHGMSRFDSLIDSCSKRARPIVMTTIAMIAGMTPIAMGWAGDPSFRAPMGVAVIGGLLVSTVMSLFIVPAMFTVVDDFQQWLSRFGRGTEADAGPMGAPSAVG